jgi:hypothetical protein
MPFSRSPTPSIRRAHPLQRPVDTGETARVALGLKLLPQLRAYLAAFLPAALQRGQVREPSRRCPEHRRASLGQFSRQDIAFDGAPVHAHLLGDPTAAPALGHLHRLRRTHCGPPGELPSAIPADHLDLGLGLEPASQGCGLGIRQDLDGLAAFQVDEPGAIPPAPPKGKRIPPEHPRRGEDE